VQHCPFCSAPETDRLDLEGQRFLVFACTFSPRVDPQLGEEALATELARNYPAGSGGRHFRGMCDRLHLFVAKGEGARVLKAAERS
jgi:hypothetical protein